MTWISSCRKERYLTHANYFKAERFKSKDLAPMFLPDSYVRTRRLYDLMQSHHGKLSVEVMQGLLQDHDNHPSSICCHQDPHNPMPLGKMMKTLVSIISRPKSKRHLLHTALHAKMNTWNTHCRLYKMPDLNEEIIAFLKSYGASLVGFADLKEIDTEARENFPYGIIIAVVLDPKVVSDIKIGPTAAYYAEYKKVNTLLDELAQQMVLFLIKKGFKAKDAPPPLKKIRPTSPPNCLIRPLLPGQGWGGLVKALCWLPGSTALRSGWCRY